MSNDIIENIERSETLWPYNTHLLERPRIEDYVRHVLRHRGDATCDGPALITPLGLVDTHDDTNDPNSEPLTDVAMCPVDEPDVMIATMDLTFQKGINYGGDGFVCAECTNRIPGGYGYRHFEIIWVSAPPSIVGVALCPPCADTIIAGFKPVRV